MKRYVNNRKKSDKCKQKRWKRFNNIVKSMKDPCKRQARSGAEARKGSFKFSSHFSATNIQQQKLTLFNLSQSSVPSILPASTQICHLQSDCQTSWSSKTEYPVSPSHLWYRSIDSTILGYGSGLRKIWWSAHMIRSMKQVQWYCFCILAQRSMRSWWAVVRYMSAWSSSLLNSLRLSWIRTELYPRYFFGRILWARDEAFADEIDCYGWHPYVSERISRGEIRAAIFCYSTRI